MVKLKNLISRISVSHFQKQPFVGTTEKSLYCYLLIDFLSCFRISVVGFEKGFVWCVRNFNDSKNSSGYSTVSPAKKYMLRASNENLRNNRRNSNENLFKKQPPDVFYKKSVLI